MRKYLRNLLFILIIMSSSRSVQAAQRRRAGPSSSEPGIPGRGPQPSINSAQMFANQARPGNGPNMPTGRLAGQYAAQQQKQMMQQQQQEQQGLNSVTKMTITQAITLITLRLGALETKMMNGCGTGEEGIDSSIIATILSRLDELEQNGTGTGVSSEGSSGELQLLKQQIDNLKQTIVQSKTQSNSVAKEHISLKTQIDQLKKELKETKELLVALQNLTMDNSQKILELSSMDLQQDEQIEMNDDETEFDINNLDLSELKTIEDE